MKILYKSLTVVLVISLVYFASCGNEDDAPVDPTDQGITDEEVTDEEVTDEEVTDEEVTDEEVIDGQIIDGIYGTGLTTLKIPSTLSGTNIELTMDYGTTEFYTGYNTVTRGFNGSYLGPVLILNKGDLVNVTVNNNQTDATTVHWHGMHVPPNVDGGPHVVIAANSTWEPSFTVLDEAGTSWYHPHLHEKTKEQVNAGLAGMIIVRDESAADQALLPKTYGVDEFPLILQYQVFNSAYQLANSGTTVTMVNGTIDPILEVPAQMVRFHILNAEDDGNFTLNMSTGEDLMVIATEGGLLDAPVMTPALEIVNGERYEIILDLSAYEGQTIHLQNTAQIGGGGGGGRTNADNMVTLIVGSPTSSALTTIPSAFTTVPAYDQSTATVTRTKILAGPGWTIDGVQYDHDVNNEEIYLDDVEIWEITNNSNIEHPFHIHDVQFYILDIDGAAPPAYKAGRKDVVQVKAGETVRFITKFEDFADNDFPFMYHCHILPHEDKGMMGQFIVKQR
jgi:blue copper oxidase